MDKTIASSSKKMSPLLSKTAELCAKIKGLENELLEHSEQSDGSGSFCYESLKLLQSHGIFAACAPVEVGGSGINSLHDMTIIISRVAEVDASLATILHMHLVLVRYFAAICPTEGPDISNIIWSWLKGVGDKNMLISSAVSESGIPNWMIETTAERSLDGWLINGSKSLVTGATGASHFYTRVRVKSEDGDRIGSVMIPRISVGVIVKDDWEGLGLRSTGSNTVVFENVLVPDGSILNRGRWGLRGKNELGRALSVGPLLGVTLGIAEGARRIAHTHAIRQVNSSGFGGRLQSETVMLVAEIEVRITAMRAIVSATMADLDVERQKLQEYNQQDVTGSVLLRLVALSQVTVERYALEIIDMAMQACGGASYKSGHRLGRKLRDVRACMFMRPYVPSNAWADFITTDILQDGQA